MSGFLLPFGKRLFKTGLAVFITAQICDWLGWPMIFAVIAAIVTVEPTVHASISKGKIRLPAAAAGASFAMLFDAWFGPQPITFTLSALATIYVCNLLGWNQALIVSTLTAVNMISVSESHFLLEFLVRLGTTTIGLVVSAMVNYLVFPPDFTREIRDLLEETVGGIREQADRVLRGIARDVDVSGLADSVGKLETLLEHQLADLRYKRRAGFAALRGLARDRRLCRIARRALFYLQTAATSPYPEERKQCLRLLEAAANQLAASWAASIRPR